MTIASLKTKIRPIILVSTPNMETGLGAFDDLFEGDTPFQESLERVSDTDLFLPAGIFAPEQLKDIAQNQSDDIGYDTAGFWTFEGYASIVNVFDRDEIFLLIPAPIMVEDVTAFERACTDGLQAALQGYVVCFAMMADFAAYPASYIRVGPRLEAGYGGHKVSHFQIATNFEQAKIYFEDPQSVQFSQISLLSGKTLEDCLSLGENSLEDSFSKRPECLSVNSLLTPFADLSSWHGVWKAKSF